LVSCCKGGQVEIFMMAPNMDRWSQKQNPLFTKKVVGFFRFVYVLRFA